MVKNLTAEDQAKVFDAAQKFRKLLSRGEPQDVLYSFFRPIQTSAANIFWGRMVGGG